ncbi:MAG TPA: hypothetical protein VF933_17750 [Streptosporangiaceae bacterium]
MTTSATPPATPGRTVYRTRDAATVAALKGYNADWNTYRAAITDALKEAGAGGYNVVAGQSGLQPGRFFGIHVPRAAEPPKGWRHSHTADCAVPGKRTTIGRALAARLDEIQHPGDPMRHLPGMPSAMLHAGRLVTPGIRLLEDGQAIYVTWTAEPDGARGIGSAEPLRVDHRLWQRVRLSEHYAAVERADAANPAVTTS